MSGNKLPQASTSSSDRVLNRCRNHPPNCMHVRVAHPVVGPLHPCPQQKKNKHRCTSLFGTTRDRHTALHQVSMVVNTYVCVCVSMCAWTCMCTCGLQTRGCNMYVQQLISNVTELGWSEDTRSIHVLWMRKRRRSPKKNKFQEGRDG